MLTDDWKSEQFRADVGRWARAAAAVTAWKSLKVAIFGYAMNDMGDIRVDESALIRSLGPEILAVAQGDLYRGMLQVTKAQLDEVIAFEDEQLRDRPARCRRRSAPTTPGCRSRSSTSWTRAATAPTPRTSTRSARTAGSPGCRWPPPPR